MSTETTAQKRSVLDGRSVLLLEDEFIIALDAENILNDLGASEITVVNTLTAAREAIGEGQYDVALLDININGEMSYPLAEACAEKGMTVLFASGYELREPPMVGGRAAPSVSKPYTRETLKIALAKALASANV